MLKLIAISDKRALLNRQSSKLHLLEVAGSRKRCFINNKLFRKVSKAYNDMSVFEQTNGQPANSLQFLKNISFTIQSTILYCFYRLSRQKAVLWRTFWDFVLELIAISKSRCPNKAVPISAQTEVLAKKKAIQDFCTPSHKFSDTTNSSSWTIFHCPSAKKWICLEYLTQLNQCYFTRHDLYFEMTETSLLLVNISQLLFSTHLPVISSQFA